jgi:hypothetical protein
VAQIEVDVRRPVAARRDRMDVHVENARAKRSPEKARACLFPHLAARGGEDGAIARIHVPAGLQPLAEAAVVHEEERTSIRPRDDGARGDVIPLLPRERIGRHAQEPPNARERPPLGSAPGPMRRETRGKLRGIDHFSTWKRLL